MRTLAIILLLLSILTVRPETTIALQSQSTPGAALQPWTAQLERLDPARPMEYFELGEVIADVAETGELRETARRLFALAGGLDPQRLGRSAALALADMETDATAKRRLLALAALLDPHGSSSAAAGDADRVSSTVLETVSRSFSLYRLGRGPQALDVLEGTDAEALLRRYNALLPGGYNQFVQDCRIYRANLRPTLSSGELVRMLRLEAGLLAGDDRSWSSDLLLRDRAPLIEVDPQRIDETLRVDVSRCVYRNGQWVAPTMP